MAKLQSVADLISLKESILVEKEKVRQNQIVISVGTGTCGLAAGAGDTLEQIEIELEKRNISAVLQRVGCIGICVREPLVDIQLPGKPRVTYGNVKSDMVARIIDEHVIGGKPVVEWAIGVLPEDW
jgi:(2Fe-2S) ferredoxin